MAPPTIETISTRSGDTSVSVNGKLLHSKYDPRKEAFRYLERFDLSGTSVCVLIEPGINYLSETIQEKHPKMRILSLHCCEEVHALSRSSLPSLFSLDTQQIHSFISSHIDDYMLSRTRVMEWDPSARAFGDLYLKLSSSVSSYFRIRNSSITTTGLFGRRWLSRRLRSFLELDRIARPLPSAAPGPLVIAASGPGLHSVIPALLSHRQKLTLWALSSAIGPLREAGIQPDLIFHSDTGYYAQHYLRGIDGSAPIAAPLTASVVKDIAARVPRLPILSESSMERVLLEESGIPSLKIPSHGTVAGTAFYAAVGSLWDTIFFAGLDFAFRDIAPHASGHSFSRLHLSRSDRFNPLHTIYYRRSPVHLERGVYFYRRRENGPEGTVTRWVQNEALHTYAGWFAARGAEKRIYRIAPSPVPIPGFQDITAEEFADYAVTLPCAEPAESDGNRPEKHLPFEITSAPPIDIRIGKARELTRKLKNLTEEYENRCSATPSDAADFLHGRDMLYEFASESDISTLLRFLRDKDIETGKKLAESLYSSLEKLETTIDGYQTD